MDYDEQMEYYHGQYEEFEKAPLPEEQFLQLMREDHASYLTTNPTTNLTFEEFERDYDKYLGELYF
jgi:hypothetical protein